MNVTTDKQRGFTLIEVILVLAIAALIFLMIFVALPALQASQRDSARRNDAGVVAAAVQSYMSTERTALTATSDSDLQAFISDLDQYEPSDVSVEAAATGAVTVASDQIRVYIESKCAGTELQAGVSRSAAVVVNLEGGNGSNYCVDV